MTSPPAAAASSPPGSPRSPFQHSKVRPLLRAGQSKKFIVSVDGSLSSLHALQHAAELAHKDDEIVIFTVSCKPVKELKEVWINADKVLQEAEALYNSLPRKPKRYRTALRAATDPRKEILAFVKEEEPDYVIMGTRGLSGVKRVVLGSVSDYMARNSPCPVLIVREPEDPSGDFFSN